MPDRPSGFERDRRGLTPVVEKTLGAGIALLYVSGMLGLLLGGFVPEYQTMAGAELGERTLATAAGHVEDAQPGVDGRVNVTRTVDLPPTIRGSSYWLVLRNGTLVLDHPDDALDRRITLALDENVTTRDTRWRSGTELTIHVTGPTADRTIALGGPG